LLYWEKARSLASAQSPATDESRHVVGSVTEYIAGLKEGRIPEIPMEFLPENRSAQPTRLPAPSAEFSGSAMPKVGRNDPCPCGSGRKYKHCHGKPGK